MTRQTFTVTQVSDLSAALRAVIQAAPPAAVSMTDVVRQLAPSIEELRLRGYTMEAIVQLLKERGFTIKLSTFRSIHKRKASQ